MNITVIGEINYKDINKYFSHLFHDINRERDTERYIYIERERKQEREREKEKKKERES